MHVHLFKPEPVIDALLAEAERRGISRAELARRMGVHQSLVSYLSRPNRKDLRISTVAHLLYAMGLPWGWLDGVTPLDSKPLPPPKTCANCGQQLIPPRPKFCSRACNDAAVAAARTVASRPERAAKRRHIIDLYKAKRPVPEIAAETGYTEAYVNLLVRQWREGRKM